LGLNIISLESKSSLLAQREYLLVFHILNGRDLLGYHCLEILGHSSKK
jgi:hypothetical protein